jgi:alkylhydroperoxidase family enzyme
MSPVDLRNAAISTSPHFADLTEAETPAAAAPLLAKARGVFGFVPNLAVVMAEEPAALESYSHSLQAFGETSLNAIEQQIVLMAVSRADKADYSLAIHAALASLLGATPNIVKAVATGGPLYEPRLAALRRFTEMLAIGRGRISDAELEAFFAAGYDRTAVVAVAFGVAVKSFANMLAHVAQTPVDAAFASTLADLRS